MKINLVIEADTPEELRAACAKIGGGEACAKIGGERNVTRRDLDEAQTDTETLSTLVTGEPDDPYGDGNGPVDVVIQRTEPQPEPDATPSETPDRDAADLPWDERIHSGSKALNKDGTWRRRKGVDDETVAAVEAELRGGDEPDVAPDAPAPEPVQEQAPQADIQPDAPTALTVEETGNALRDYTAKDVMQVIGSAMSSGSRVPTYIAELCQEARIGQIVEIFSNADALAAIVAKLRKDGVISDV